jgi:hypothetical protein
MPLINSVRKLFTRRRPLELTVTHRATGTDGPPAMILAESISTESLEAAIEFEPEPESEPTEPLAVLGRIEQAFEDDRDARNALADHIAQLPTAVEALTTLADRQQRLVELTRSISDQGRAAADCAARHAELLQSSFDRQTDTIGLIQRQLDANHQLASHTADHLARLGEGLFESTQTNRRTSDALTAIVDQAKTRGAQQDAQFRRLQGWMIATAVASIATVIAAVTLAWVVLSS